MKIQNSTNLEELYQWLDSYYNVPFNQITASIPSSLKYCNNLASLDLSFNNLSGEIPSELYDLGFLNYVNFSYNNLSGPVPLPLYWPFNFTCDLLLHGQITNDSATFKATVCEGNKDLHPDFSDCSSFYSPPSKTYLLPSKDSRIIHSIKKYLIHYFFTDTIKGEKLN